MSKWRRQHRPHGPACLEGPLQFEEVRQHRHMACGLYSMCLELAARRRWISFSCTACSLWPDAQPRSSLEAARSPATVLALPLGGRG